MTVLFVCTGNTCRSPMAAGYLASKKLPDVTAESRGLYADGSPVSENAAAVMAEAGIDISGHVSKTVTKEDVETADRIICLSPSHKEALLSAGVAPEKLSVLGGGVSDPFGQGKEVYRVCRDEIFRAIDEQIREGFFEEFSLLAMEARHLPAVAKLEKTCFSEPWSEDALLESYRHGTKFFVAEKAGRLLGYAGVNAVADEGYITNVAVFPSCRRQGVGTALIGKVLAFAKERGLAFVSLEVRASNREAITLYEKAGFRQEGRRKEFYRAPKEDALIMTKRF